MIAINGVFIIIFLTFFGTKLYDVIMYYPKFHIEQKTPITQVSKKGYIEPCAETI